MGKACKTNKQHWHWFHVLFFACQWEIIDQAKLVEGMWYILIGRSENLRTISWIKEFTPFYKSL